MRPISSKVKKKLESDPRMKVCALQHGNLGSCEGRIEWHHVWIYAGKQIDEAWSIIGLCKRHHRFVDADPMVRRAAEKVSLLLATAADLAKYSRKNWEQIKISIGL